MAPALYKQVMQKEDEDRYIYAMQSALTPTQTPKAPKLHHWQGTYLLERIKIQDGCLIHQTIRTIATWADVPLRGGRVEGGKQLSEYPERIEIQVFPLRGIVTFTVTTTIGQAQRSKRKKRILCLSNDCLSSTLRQRVTFNTSLSKDTNYSNQVGCCNIRYHVYVLLCLHVFRISILG